MADEKLQIWAVSDGRAGIANQAIGLAEAVARLTPAEVTIKTISWKGRIGRLPSLFNILPRRWVAPESRIEPPWPDLWIAAGRATLPFSIRLRRWTRGQTYVVQIQDPRLPPPMFDLVVPPRHDRIEGDNVLSITGSPNRITPERLTEQYKAFESRLGSLPRPRVALLVGGDSKAFRLPVERAAAIANELRLPLEQEGGSLMMSFSRRTPEAAKALLNARLRDLPGMIWDGEGPNPYFAFLEAADYILVTEDSANMAAEAASTGKPVFIVKMEGDHLKFRALHEDLERRGAARPFGGAFHGWSYEPLRETDRAAAEVLQRMRARAGPLPP
jgi:mitochondrial fission protein ELM1